MQLYSYLFPSVVSIPPGYSCAVTIPFQAVSRRLERQDVEISVAWKVISDGQEIFRRVQSFGQPRGDRAISELVFDWRPDEQGVRDAVAFAEIEISNLEQVPCFRNRMPVVSYSVAWKTGRKSLLCGTAYKYGSPQIIDMMSEFGTFVEGFPAIHVDRAHDLSQSLTFINPYMKAIVVDILSSDKRALPRMRVGARSVRTCELSSILRPDEDRWLGQIQLTASNRIITYVNKHSFSDATFVVDQEHLDPYRSDPTKIPLTHKLRLLYGEMMRRRRATRLLCAP